jgi:hypothetical protein
MSLHTLPHVRMISKAKKSPHPLRNCLGISCPSPMVSQDKEVANAL